MNKVSVLGGNPKVEAREGRVIVSDPQQIMQEKIRALSTEFYSAFQAVSKDKNAARYADGATAQDQAALIKAVAVLANELEENRLLDEKDDATPSDEAGK